MERAGTCVVISAQALGSLCLELSSDVAGTQEGRQQLPYPHELSDPLLELFGPSSHVAESTVDFHQAIQG